MNSAFGVEHFSKSYVPKHVPGGRGGKFIPATQLTNRERSAMKTNFSRKKRVRRVLKETK